LLRLWQLTFKILKGLASGTWVGLADVRGGGLDLVGLIGEDVAIGTGSSGLESELRHPKELLVRFERIVVSKKLEQKFGKPQEQHIQEASVLHRTL